MLCYADVYIILYMSGLDVEEKHVTGAIILFVGRCLAIKVFLGKLPAT